MSYSYLMYTASVLYFMCYIPELYANYKNKNANFYNVPEKIIMLTATIMAFSYAVINNKPELIANYGPILVLDIVALNMRLYYYLYLNSKPVPHEIISSIEVQSMDVENNV